MPFFSQVDIVGGRFQRNATLSIRETGFSSQNPRVSLRRQKIRSTFRERRRLFHQRSRHRMYRTYRRGAYHGPTFLLVCGRIFWTLGYRYESFSLFIVSRRKKQSKNSETLFKCICSATFAEETGCATSFRDRSSRRHQKRARLCLVDIVYQYCMLSSLSFVRTSSRCSIELIGCWLLCIERQDFLLFRYS